jgi:CBS domain-containing protein
MPQISEVMVGPVITIDQDDTALNAAEMMRDNDTGDVVVTQDGHLIGILTDRDITVRVVAEGREPETAVREICSGDPVTLSPDDDLDRAVELMSENAIRRLPVCEGNQVVGFISLGDVALHTEAEAALTDISSAPSNN